MNKLNLSDQQFTLEGVSQDINFEELTEVCEGVRCGVFAFKSDDSKDLGVIVVNPGYSTPLQLVVSGDRTIEGIAGGLGTLRILRAGGGESIYEFETIGVSCAVDVKVGDQMQWTAAEDEYLIFYEVCFPKYHPDRFLEVES